jgi:hypothetical protein
MKTKLLITVFAFVFCIISASASGLSSLTLTIEGNANYKVRLNHQWTSFTGNEFYFDQLMPGNHHVRILKLSNRRNNYGHQAVLVYDGVISLPAHADVVMRLNRFGMLQMVSCQNSIQTVSCYDYNIVNEPFCNPAVSDEEFFGIRNVIAQRTFESSRVELAHQVLRGRMFTSAQVASLLEVFTFESSRLEIAKAAYVRTVDPLNYYLVYSAFTFDSSISDLNRFIG